MTSNEGYYIVAEESGEVLGIEGGSAHNGAKVITYSKQQGDEYQRWIFNSSGTIASVASTNLVLDIKGPGGAGEEIVVWGEHGGFNQRWVYSDGVIHNQDEKNLVIESRGTSQQIIVGVANDGNVNQKWRLIPVNVITTQVIWGDVDSILDQIIALANSLKLHTGEVKSKFDAFLVEREAALQKVDVEKRALESTLSSTSTRILSENSKIQLILDQKDSETKRKLAEYDITIRTAKQERGTIEREIVSYEHNAGETSARINNLFKDLEDDAIAYQRLRPSRPILDKDDLFIIREMFMSNTSITRTGKLCFKDLQQLINKFGAAEPAGKLKNINFIVENDAKSRMSYVTFVAVANDLAAIVADFRKIDTNRNGTLSKKEFRDYFSKLGFSHRNVIDSIFGFVDEDESGDVAFHEFVHLSVILLVLHILFSTNDYDKNGKLSRDEILHILSEVSLPSSFMLSKFDDFYSAVDKDDVRFLDFNEFVLLVFAMFGDQSYISPDRKVSPSLSSSHHNDSADAPLISNDGMGSSSPTHQNGGSATPKNNNANRDKQKKRSCC